MSEITLNLLTLFLLPLVIAILQFLTTWLTEKFKLKSKKLEVEDSTVKACKEQHENDIKVVEKKFNNRLDDIEVKMDSMKETQQKTQLQITRLRAGVEKNNNVIERTFKNEKDLAVLFSKVEALEHKAQ